MIISIIAKDVNEAFIKLCHQAVTWPIEVRRGGIEMMDSPGPVMIEIEEPRLRVLNVPTRNNSLPAACAETLWILAGRNDIEWLQFYLPRAPDFSDDGKVWRAGYGPRLRNFNCRYESDQARPGDVGVDQLKFVVDELKTLPNSRRAIVSLIDIERDLSKAPVMFKDFPCNLTLSFMIRDGKLDLVVFCRSQDLIWGASGINWFEFTVIQELVADLVGVSVGKYYHTTNNLHVYSRHFEMVNKINSINHLFLGNLLDVDDDELFYDKLGSSLVYDKSNVVRDLDESLKDIFNLENAIRNRSIAVDDLDGTEFFMTNRITLIGDIAVVMLAYCAYKIGSKDLSAELQSRILDKAMLNSYERYITWLNRPRVPKLEVE